MKPKPINQKLVKSTNAHVSATRFPSLPLVNVTTAKRLTAVAPLILLFLTMLFLYAERGRMGNDMLTGGEPYLHARLARTFHQRGILSNDHMLSGGIPVAFTPYKAIVIVASSVLGDTGASFFSPLLLALIAIFSLNRLLSQLGRSPLERVITLCVIIITPTFMHDILITGPRMAVIALQLAMATLLLDYSWIHKTAGVGAAMLSASFSPLSGFATIILGTLLLNQKPHAWRWITAIALASVLGSSLIPSDYVFNGAGSGIGLGSGISLSDLGASDGLPTFTLLLGVMGLWLIWPHKTICAAILALIAGAFFDSRLLSGANISLGVLTGATLAYFYYRTWHIKDLKYFALLVITCGILFSSISAGVRLASIGPSLNEVTSLQWLKNHSRSGEVVLSSPINGHWIQYIAIRPTVLDERAGNDRLSSATAAFQTYNIKNAEEYLHKTNTSYIYITPDMTNGLVWQEPGQGLHYLLTNPETFKKVYEADGIEIYEYLNKPAVRRP